MLIAHTFIRLHLDYGDVVYDQPENESFSSKIKSDTMSLLPQYELYRELGLESLWSRRWLRRMCFICKLIKTQKPLYLYNLISPKLNSLLHPNTYSVMRCRNDCFKNSFIHYVVRGWDRLSNEIRFYLSLNQLALHCFLFITLLVSNY